jgi:hypothetical protein
LKVSSYARRPGGSRGNGRRIGAPKPATRVLLACADGAAGHLIGTLCFPANALVVVPQVSARRHVIARCGVAEVGDCRQKSNNNEAIDGVALFCTGLTLETYVTGAQDPVKCSVVRKRQPYGRRNPPKRRTVPYRCRSGLDHARVKDDRVSLGSLRRAGSDPRGSLLPGTRAGSQPVPQSCLRRYHLIAWFPTARALHKHVPSGSRLRQGGPSGGFVRGPDKPAEHVNV